MRAAHIGSAALLVSLLLACGQGVTHLEEEQHLAGWPVDTVDHCDPRNMTGYSTASSLARSIANGDPWDFSDETASLALIDSFEHSPHRAFYYHIILKTLPRADGYFAEPLGLVMRNYLLDHTCSMLRCCWENGCDTYEGFKGWTRVIAHEFLIEHEEDPWKAFVTYGRQVEQSAQVNCDMQTGSRANEFLYAIGEHIKRAMEQDSISI